jgi:hypothetical protein
MLRGSAVEEDHPGVGAILSVLGVGDEEQREGDDQDQSCWGASRSRPMERSCGSHTVPGLYRGQELCTSEDARTRVVAGASGSA